MDEKNLEYLIVAGMRDDYDPAEKEEIYLRVTSTISDYQTSYKSAAVAVAVYQKHKFYERDGMKSAKDYLLSLGYSKGAISHLVKFGEFIILMGLAPHQIPSESLVRPILTNKNEGMWCEHYTAACKKHMATKVTSGNTNVTCNRAASRAANAEKTESDINLAREDDTCNEDGDENTAEIVDGTNPINEGDDPIENEAGSPNIGSEVPTPENPIFNHIPTRAEIHDVLAEYRRNDPDNIYLTAIGEVMPRDGNFTSGVLEKFKEKLISVPILRRVVQNFKAAGGALTGEDISAINDFCKNIHDREENDLRHTINGEPEADEIGDSIEEAADDDGE